MNHISIIIPTYNRKDVISDTINSIFLQEGNNGIEIIVIDDGSTDNTCDIVHNISKDINYTFIKHSGLPSVVRNVGIRKAKGDFIAFLDSDDVWLPHKLLKQLDILKKYPKVGIIASNAYILQENGVKTNAIYQKERIDVLNGFLFYELLRNNFLITSSVLIRRECLKTINKFSENPKLRALEDYDLWLRLALKYHIYYDPEPLLYYRDADSSIRSEQSYINYWINLFSLYKGLEQDLNQNFDVYPEGTKKSLLKAVKRSENDSIANLFYRIIDDRDFSLMLKYFFKCIKFSNVFFSVLLHSISNYLIRSFPFKLLSKEK